MPKEVESQTAIAVMDPLIGTIFDQRFRIEEKIASGGFGAIYRATHVKSGHPIALKVLHPDLASDLGVLARFRREGATMTSLRNPHTLTAYELGQAADRTLFIVMELLAGESLFDRYEAGGAMPWKNVAKIAIQVCEALEEAHALGIVHRDLKPTNIHLERQGDDPDFAKVLDFGIAKILRGSESFDASDITNAGQMIGTLDYMSPEQMVGGAVTGQTDIYTLGIVMYEMIAGMRPFPEAQSAVAALAAMLKLRPKPLYLRAAIPEELDRIVMRCLEKDVERRYATVTDLQADLVRLMASLPADPTRTLPVEVVKPRAVDLDPEATTVTPPPEKILESLRTPKLERVEPRPLWDDDDDDSDATIADDSEITNAAARRRAESETKARAATTVHRSGADDGAATPRAERRHPADSPPGRPTPPPRPLESRHTETPLPQVIVAPFSSTPRGPQLATPARGVAQAPQLPQLPQLPMTPYPGQPGFGPMPSSFPTASSRPSTYDMGRIAAREAAIRRLVWIVVVVVGMIVGVIIATQL